MEDANSAVAQADVEKKISQVVPLILEPLSDGFTARDKAVALIRFTVLLNSLATPDDVPGLRTVVQPLVDILACDDVALQRNACVCLTALASSSEQLWSFSIQDTDLVVAAVTHVSGMQDEVQLGNLLGLVSVIARGGDDGAKALLSAQVAPAVVASVSRCHSPGAQEAAADALCALASCADCRPGLAQEGAVQALAALLPVAESEVRVRTLMALGMLLPGSAEGRAALAGAPGAVPHLLAIMQKSDDEDCKVVARDLFALLARDEDLKQQIAASLRSQTANASVVL